MALADERNGEPGSGYSATTESFDRQPPQDLAAEQSVLGGMMLSKDAIADVVEKLRPHDFYRPAHQAIYDCVLDLYGRGEPADAITVSAELERRQELGRVGGAPYMHTLIATVPTAANAGYYAEIVAEKAVLRRLVEAGTRIVQLGYNGSDGSPIEEVVDRAQASIYDVTERRTSEDYAALEDLLQPTMDEIDAIASRGGDSQGLPTGFADLDELTNGLHAGQMIIVAARPGVGKALALDTPLATPGGWTTMGEVAVGDQLLGADGRPVTVVDATDVLHQRPCYDIGFSDGTTITADAGHQWALADGRVDTTENLAFARQDVPVHRGPDDGAPRLITGIRPLPSVPVRCVQVDAADHLYLAGRSSIPTHNSTLGLDFARAASVKHGAGSVIFSLEMGRTEIVMRMLSAEARIRLADMRGGRMTDDDWTRLARRMSEISEAPLFVDDSPNLTMMEIRAKARRLKQRSDIQLIVVDYMQLMTSGKRVESRQQEVSEFSRNLKLLAKELEVPVVAISQLNRGPEQRTDKKPQLADLRESGCVTASTRLLRADTGAEITFAELMRTGERPVVWSLDNRMRLVARPITNVFASGIKEAFRVRLASGREVEATANHPMLTLDGWMPLGELVPGTRIAAPRRVPEPRETAPMPEREIVMLARSLGEWNPSTSRLDELERVVPDRVFALPDDHIALFLRELWATQTPDDGAGDARLRHTTASNDLAADLARLLLRIGVVARIEPVWTGDHESYQVLIEDPGNRRTFSARTGFRDADSAASGPAEDIRAPGGLVRPVHDRHRQIPGCDGSRESTLVESAAGGTALACAEPEAFATNDVVWDEIVSITSVGEQPVYDATVDGTHNFIADGIVLHNSLEQDADMVILIHRPDAFERDDPRMGEADLILAKHRSGPVSTVTVAHQLHYSRFVDMAQE